MKEEPNEISAAARTMFLESLRSIARWWAAEAERRGLTMQEACDGTIFSTLVLIDGMSGELSPINLVLDVPPEDRNDWPNGLIINDNGMLHDEYYLPFRRKPEFKITIIYEENS